ncbi:MAG TPA: serine hydrolase domain-containing protein [Candidatus Limnocylindria bacterium]
MPRPIRLAAGWSLAMLAAFLLNLALPRPTVAPEVAALTPTRSPAASRPATTPGPLPPAASPHPGDDGGALRPVELAPLSGEQAAALQAATDRARQAFGLDALSIGVSLHGTSGWTGASGFARDGVTRLDGDSPFAIASITKTFTATLVLQLVEEGRLSLRDRAADLLPGVRVPSDVTVAQLLRHTSGIADLLPTLREPLNADLERTWSAAEVAEAVPEPWFAPGRAYAYSNTNYVLLGLIVERVGGRSYAAQLRDRLLHPLELSSTGMLTANGAPPLMTRSWASAFGTAGCIYSSAHDLLAWGDALYGGHVLAPSSLRHMLAFERHDYGLGAETIHVGELTGYGHSGLLRGYTSLVVHLPQHDITMVVMGTTALFDPARLLAHRQDGGPSIADLAERFATAR